jgi:hypothetical protein
MFGGEAKEKHEIIKELLLMDPQNAAITTHTGYYQTCLL